LEQWVPRPREKFDNAFSRFDIKYECDGQIDRQKPADCYYCAYAYRRAVK